MLRNCVCLIFVFSVILNSANSGLLSECLFRTRLYVRKTEEEDDSQTEERFPGNDRKRRRREEMKNSFLELEKALECPQTKKRSKAQILMDCMKCVFIKQQRTAKLEAEISRLKERQKHLDRILTDVEAQLVQNKKTMKEQISTHRPPKRRRENDISEDEDSEEDGPQR